MTLKTRWHICFGTYASRLHGGSKPTTDRQHNRFGQPQIVDQPAREQFERSLLSATPIFLSPEQRLFVESVIPALAKRGGWDFIDCAAQPNHVHAVLDVDPAIHGKRVRALLKRWLTQALDDKWTGAIGRNDGMTWWAEGGSARVVRGREYRFVAPQYVHRQRITQSPRPAPSDPF